MIPRSLGFVVSARCFPLFILVAHTFCFQPRILSLHTPKRFRMDATEIWSSERLESVEEVTSLNFDDELWELYRSTMTEVMESRRVKKKDTNASIKPVQEYLISKETLLNIPSPILSDQREIQDSMMDQATRFRNHYNFTVEQYQFAFRSLIYFGDACAKRSLGSVVVVSWHKLKEAGMIPRENSVSTYMYILSAAEDTSTCSEALDEVAALHDLIYSPNEKTIFLRMKRLLGKGDIDGAEKILYSLPNKGDGLGEWKRLRTFLPILEYYCSIGNATSMLRLLTDMRQSPGVILDAEAYAMVIGSLAQFGFFKSSSSLIEGYRNAGFEASHGPELFDEIAAMMGEDILELTETAAGRIFEDFVTGFGGSSHASVDSCISIPSLLDGACDTPGLKIGRVEITLTTGFCPATGAKLRLFRLDEEQRQHVHDQLLEMARLSYQEFTKNRASTSDKENQDYGLEQLSKFSEWLDTREGEPFTAVVDGANVAYFGFPELHYSQVKLVVDELRRIGENPLVVLPKKYTYPTFLLSTTPNSQTLTDRDTGVIKSLDDEGALYTVPPRCLDDYFWMLASVSNQTVARNRCDLRVSPENADGRFPGLRPMLVTNDRMRDHKLDLLEPREFRRWCSCHIVNYNMSAYASDEWNDDRRVDLSPADFFSREIQGNRHGEENGNVWHFPVVDWEEPSRFCVWIAR